MRTWLVVVVSLWILGSARWSTAEINLADSIEWIIADSQRVVVATVQTATEERPGWWRLQLAVTDTLKGPKAQTLDVIARTAPPKQPGEHLVFLVATSPARAARDCPGQTVEAADCRVAYARAPLAIRRGRWGDSDVLPLDGSGRAYTRDHDVVTTRKALLSTVRGAVKTSATEAFQLDLPLDSPAGKALYGGSAVWLFVPVDAALEQDAIRWVAASSSDLRVQGADALSRFRSAANIARLTQLLADPAHHEIVEAGKPTKLRYPVRKRAHEALAAWGVAHVTPVIERAKP